MNMSTSDHESSDSDERRGVGRSKLLNQVVGTPKPKVEKVDSSAGSQQNSASPLAHRFHNAETVIISMVFS